MMNSGVYMNLFDIGDDDGWKAFEEAVREENNVVRYAAEGLTASVFVADQPAYHNRYLAVNGKIEASTNADLETQLMCAHIPLLLHDAPRDVMVIGLASGITVGAVATHPVESIRVVEVEKAMVPAAELFADYNHDVLQDPRLELSINDARNELEFSPRMYDVIISEPSNPWMTVASNLFTEDFFRMARTRVKPGGIFSQWIQNYYLPAEDLRSIVAAFHDSFRYVLLFETYGGVDLLMMGSDEPLVLDLDELGERMGELQVRMDLGRVGIRAPLHVVSLYRLGTEEIARLIEGAPRNTDDNARVEFSAPKTLGVSTVDENNRLIHGAMGDPLAVIRPVPADTAEADHLRLALARIWLRRETYDLVVSAARAVTTEDLRGEADGLLLEAARKGLRWGDADLAETAARAVTTEDLLDEAAEVLEEIEVHRAE
jgi:spermidine synthase